ncbi:unnamed protein product [Eruca vesicaria subsp. sativa]|uniref:Uncharacterized protein n=1 Tax=Eruca vesicaria subsp. sativa TaxID=29727 RepID=A0ABC8JWD7_ERUVS|nr:unnamed protein product [Eruca vesicaria subsp. sativa]
MPGSHGEITVDEQNGVDNDHKTTTRRRKKKKEKEEDENQSVIPSISKPRKRFIDKFRKKPKSPKRSSSSSSSRSGGSHKGGCFSLRRRRRTEEEEGSPSSPVSDPNDECFTHEMLRVMLETNDFFSNDCNPHR